MKTKSIVYSLGVMLIAVILASNFYARAELKRSFIEMGKNSIEKTKSSSKNLDAQTVDSIKRSEKAIEQLTEDAKWLTIEAGGIMVGALGLVVYIFIRGRREDEEDM